MTKKKIEDNLVKPFKRAKIKHKNRFKDSGTLYKEKPKPLRDSKGRFLKKITIGDAIENPELAEVYGFTIIKGEPKSQPDIGQEFMAELNNRIERQKTWEENEARLLLEQERAQAELRRTEKTLHYRLKNFVLLSWYEAKYTTLMGKIWLVENLWHKPVQSLRLMGTRLKKSIKK